MEVYTTETLLRAYFRLGEKFEVYVNLAWTPGRGYSVWVKDVYTYETDLDKALIWAYRKFQEIAKEQGKELGDI